MLTIERATSKRRPVSLRASTPWGVNDTATWYGPGVVFYSTPSHGGFYLDADRLARLPVMLRKSDLRYCGAAWFEEDCEAARVVLGFPALFTADEVLEALHSLEAFDRAAAWTWASSAAGARVIQVARGRVRHARAAVGFGSACGLYGDVAPGLTFADTAAAATCPGCRRAARRAS